MKRPLLRLVAITFLVTSSAAIAGPRIIFDTDFGGDADDLGALVMLHNLCGAGECELLAVMCWNNERHALAGIVAVNVYHGHGDLPVAMRKEPPWDGDWQYGRAIAEGLGVSIVPEDVPDTTSLYRRLLAAQPNLSVTVVTVGPLGNILSLLESGADEYSSLTGANLVQEKVDRFVIMGGQYPSGDHEWNFDGGMPGVTRRVLEGIDVPIVFSGYEVGNRILTGQALNTLHAGHPLYLGYRHFSEHAEWMRAAFDGDISDNASYDQTAVLYAVRGGVGRWWNLSERGRVIADDNGGNRWVRDPEGTHRYLELAGPPQDVADVILAAMLDGRP